MVKPHRWIHSYFSKDDLERLERAVQQSESKTTAEIVPVIARQSSTTGHVFIISFLFLALLALLFPIAQLEIFAQFNHFIIYAIEIILVYFLAQLFSRWSFVKRLLTTKYDLNLQVDWRAEIEFSERIARRTEAKTGVLLFVSLMEHRAVVLAEESVNEHFNSEDWALYLQNLINNIRQEGLVVGLEKGILSLGDLLAKKLPATSNNKNEISNHLIWMDE